MSAAVRMYLFLTYIVHKVREEFDKPVNIYSAMRYKKRALYNKSVMSQTLNKDISD